MKKISTAKVKMVKDIFVKGFVNQITDESTLMFSAVAGIGQGLKYKGNIKNGLVSGVVVTAVLGTVGGVHSIIKNTQAIKKAI